MDTITKISLSILALTAALGVALYAAVVTGAEGERRPVAMGSMDIGAGSEGDGILDDGPRVELQRVEIDVATGG